MSAAAPCWLPTGTVYGTLLNFRREWTLWAPKMSEAPYKAPPKAPVLYVKTANTFAPDGAAVAVPGEVELGATIGLVIGGGIDEDAGSGPRVRGCVLLNDLSLPHASYYRPAIRYRNRDGFLVCGAACKPMPLAEIAGLMLELRVNRELVQRVDCATLVRDAAILLADVSAFQTLGPGDVLMLGTDCLPDGTRPRAGSGDRVEISAPGFAPLQHTVVEETR